MRTSDAILEEISHVLNDYTVDELRAAAREIDGRTSLFPWFGHMVEEHISATNREVPAPARERGA